MFRLAIEKSLNHMINVNSIDIERLDNSLVSLYVDDIDLRLFFLCLNSRIFVIENSEKKDPNVNITLNNKAFLSLFKGASFEDLIESEEIEVDGSIKTAQQLADLFALSPLDIEELISQYTGDVIAYQLGRTIEKIKDATSNEKDSFVENLKNEFTTLLIAPSRSKLFKKRVS
jgi:ubiquinone biosynthesis protein UbiJ